jgi:uncharacterized protein YgiM (DUF1202 family)
MKKSIIYLFILALFGCNNTSEIRYVIVKSAILREQPNVNSKKILSIPNGTELKILETSNFQEKIKINDLSVDNYWYKIKSGGSSGWIYGGCLGNESESDLEQEQENEINLEHTNVIAVNGLSIREKPDKNSKIIDKIPFGGKIKYLSKSSFGVETIKDYPKLGSGYKEGKNFEFIGKWVKISYNGKTGYALNAYLYDDKPTHKGDNREYAILYSYYSCYSNIYTPSKFNWYGLFKEKNGSFFLKKVNINYFSSENNNFGVSVGNDEGLLVIIGSKKLMKEGQRNCVDLYKMQMEETFDENKLKGYGIERQSNNEGYSKFIVKNGINKQTLNLYTEEEEKEKEHGLSSIQFIGDIDGDNIMDYIINSDEESGFDVLFLSSEKKSNNIVEPVAYFYSGYCC